MRRVALWTLFAAGLPVIGQALEPTLPIEDFARLPEAFSMELSPNGDAIAFLSQFSGRSFLCVREFTSEHPIRIRLGKALAFGVDVPREALNFEWLSNERLAVTTGVWGYVYGTLAMDRDGRNWVPLTGWEVDPHRQKVVSANEIIHKFYDDESAVLMLDRRDTSGSRQLFPNVIKVDTENGGIVTDTKNPGNVVRWIVDHAGTVRAGIVWQDDNYFIIHRPDADAPWEPVNTQIDKDEAKTSAVTAFDPTNQFLYLARLNAERRWALHALDMLGEEPEETLLTDPVYDVANDRRPLVVGQRIPLLYFSRAENKLVGAFYFTDAPRVTWFDEQYRGIQQSLDKAFPANMNLLVDESADGQKILVLSFSDRDPGRYYLIDRESRSLELLGALRPWIDPSQMAPMLAVNFTARDGTDLHGYLTLPVGIEPKGLPLVVYPHGGPWVRDIWEFNPLVQLLANRGYAVLQVNYRGSPGYGLDFYKAGTREVGGAIQEDISDATQWAIDVGLAAPERIGIMGGSFGGYAALFALATEPDRYACGISLNGVTDWLKILERHASESEYRLANAYWKREIGDLETEPEFLREISPVNHAKAIKAPVFLVQGKEDLRVPFAQAKDMAKALKEAKVPHKTLWIPGEGHTIWTEKRRIQMFTQIITFLEKHLGAGR